MVRPERPPSVSDENPRAEYANKDFDFMWSPGNIERWRRCARMNMLLDRLPDAVRDSAAIASWISDELERWDAAWEQIAALQRQCEAWQLSARWGPPAETGYVYYVHDPVAELIKIGYSLDPARRLISLKLRREAKVVWTEPGGPATERDRHRLFANLRKRHPDGGDGATEWFRDDVRIWRHIEEQDRALRIRQRTALDQEALW